MRRKLSFLGIGRKKVKSTPKQSFAQKTDFSGNWLFFQLAKHLFGLNFFRTTFYEDQIYIFEISVKSSVANPDPDPPDPRVFGPPGSGSGSFYHHAKIVRKTLIPTIL
jgi:hypothetical protein